MRQAGIIAAAGVFSLEHHIDRLAEDHDNARRFAELLADIDGIATDPRHVETNMVFFDVAGSGRSADDVVGALAAKGVVVGATGATEIRAVTHLDVGRDDVEAAAAALRDVLA
jgi:threonine aldolase